MKTDILTVYADLNKLLGDICQFLKEESEQGQLSAKSRHAAHNLIKRSQLSLKDISRIAPDNDSGRYVDMKGSTALVPEYFDTDTKSKLEESPPIYTDISAEQNTTKFVHVNECPYQNFPAHCVPYENKTGFLERKEKLLIFMEQKRKMYAAIHDNWMLLYANEKDSKPFEYHDLAASTARHMERKDLIFELHASFGDKIIQFIATTKKDAIQWVVAINDAGSNIDRRPIIRQIEFKKGTMGIAETAELYDELQGLQDDDTYNEIDDFRYSDAINAVANTLPPPKKCETIKPLFRLGPSVPDVAAAVVDEDISYDLIDNSKAAEPKWNPRLRPVPSLPNSKYAENSDTVELIPEEDEEEEEEEYDLIGGDVTLRMKLGSKLEMATEVVAGEEEEIYDVLLSPPIPRTEPLFGNNRRSTLLADIDNDLSMTHDTSYGSRNRTPATGGRKLERESFVIQEADEEIYDILTTPAVKTGSNGAAKGRKLSKVFKDEDEVYDILAPPSSASENIVATQSLPRQSYLHGSSRKNSVVEDEESQNPFASNDRSRPPIIFKPPVPALKPKLVNMDKTRVICTPTSATDDHKTASFIFKYQK